MTLPTPDYERGNVRLWQADCLDILPALEPGSVGAVVTDPPYSARTHTGHDATSRGHNGFGHDGSNRSELGYAAWTPCDIQQFIPLASQACSGWLVVMTDHTLAPYLCSEMEAVARYTFAPIPWYVPGSRVRLSGDGPSSWTTWIVVSRTARQARWGTLPGGYTTRGSHHHMGGKPVELMTELVRDYSDSPHTILDPFMGSGTTGVACVRLGRAFMGVEISEEYFNVAVKRIDAAFDDFALLEPVPPAVRQQPLFKETHP